MKKKKRKGLPTASTHEVSGDGGSLLVAGGWQFSGGPDPPSVVWGPRLSDPPSAKMTPRELEPVYPWHLEPELGEYSKQSA